MLRAFERRHHHYYSTVFSWIFNHLLRIITLLVIGCPEMNDGLSTIFTKLNTPTTTTTTSTPQLRTIYYQKSIIDENIQSPSSLLHFTSSSTPIAFQSQSPTDIVLMEINHRVTNEKYNLLTNNKLLSIKEVESNNILIEEINNSGNHDTDEENVHSQQFDVISFGTENSTIVRTQIGAVAHLPCTIYNIGDGMVTWIRRKDYHLLTVGRITYTGDERYSAMHIQHSEDWSLQIKYVQLRDAGLHECQVSTHPPTSIFIDLRVVEARAEISGPQIRYLTPGSTLKLFCRVIETTETSAFIFWYHENRMINYDADRGINVTTEIDNPYSELSIAYAKMEHSGNYSCVPSNAQPVSIIVHIFKGDNPAAMHHDDRGAFDKSYQNNFLILSMVFVISIFNITFFTNRS